MFDAVGGDTFTRSLGVVEPGGWVVDIVIPTTDELAEQARHAGITATWKAVRPSGSDLDYLNTLVESGRLRPHISQTFPLEQVADAHRAQKTGHTVGKMILTVA